MSDFMDPFERPTTARRAQGLINAIRSDIGVVDQEDENELSKTSTDWAARYRRRHEKHRTEKASFTKT